MIANFAHRSISNLKFPISKTIATLNATMQPPNNPIKEMLLSNSKKQIPQFQRFFCKQHTDITKTIVKYDEKTAKEYEARCEKGDIDAIRTYAPDLLNGLKGLKPDPNKAMRYIQYGVEKQDLRCKFIYALSLFNDERYLESIEIFKETVPLNDGASEFYMHNCYMDGKGVEKDRTKGMKLLKLSADKGYPLACSTYGFTLSDLDPTKIVYLKKAADQHEINGEFLYGNMLISDSKSGDIQTGIKYIKSTADRGYSPAQYIYAKVLYEGKIVEKDLDLSEKYLKMAADTKDKTFAGACHQYAHLLIKKETRDTEEVFKYFKKAADDDHIESINDLSEFILSGYFENHKDPKEAINYLKRGIELCSLESVRLYAKYLEEDGKDVQKAHDLFRMAADYTAIEKYLYEYLDFLERNGMRQKYEHYLKNRADRGDPSSLYIYSIYLLDKKRNEEAEKYLKKSISYGNCKSMNLYAMMIVDRDPDESLKLLKRSIEYGSTDAMFLLGLRLSNGELNTGENTKEDSFKYMKMASENNVDFADEMLGDWYFFGVNCKKNVKESMKYYKKEADRKNNARCQTYYGLCKLLGFDGLADTKVAFDYLKKADRQNYPNGPYVIGVAFAKGFGVPKDDQKASQYFKRAADLNNSMAMNAYAFLLVKDGKFEEAAAYLKKGVDLNDPECYFNLGLMHMAGAGVERDREKGEKLLKFALEKGYEDALDAGEKVYEKGKENFSLVDFIPLQLKIDFQNCDEINLSSLLEFL